MTPEMKDWYEKAMAKAGKTIEPDAPTFTFIGEYHESCLYCDRVYHPMMRYTNDDNELMYACNQCHDRAKSDNWTPRPDLTPRR